jgi:hypothetical protein
LYRNFNFFPPGNGNTDQLALFVVNATFLMSEVSNLDVSDDSDKAITSAGLKKILNK